MLNQFPVGRKKKKKKMVRILLPNNKSLFFLS